MGDNPVTSSLTPAKGPCGCKAPITQWDHTGGQMLPQRHTDTEGTLQGWQWLHGTGWGARYLPAPRQNRDAHQGCGTQHPDHAGDRSTGSALQPSWKPVGSLMGSPGNPPGTQKQQRRKAALKPWQHTAP